MQSEDTGLCLWYGGSYGDRDAISTTAVSLFNLIVHVAARGCSASLQNKDFLAKQQVWSVRSGRTEEGTDAKFIRVPTGCGVHSLSFSLFD